jgi:hypothetical protein
MSDLIPSNLHLVPELEASNPDPELVLDPKLKV